MKRPAGYPEVGELWVYDGRRTFLVLEEIGEDKKFIRQPSSYLYKCLDIEYDNVRDVEFGLYFELFKKEV